MLKYFHEAFSVKGIFPSGLESAQLFAHLSPKWCVIWCPLWSRIDVSVLACCMQINGLLAASLGPINLCAARRR